MRAHENPSTSLGAGSRAYIGTIKINPLSVPDLVR